MKGDQFDFSLPEVGQGDLLDKGVVDFQLSRLRLKGDIFELQMKLRDVLLGCIFLRKRLR